MNWISLLNRRTYMYRSIAALIVGLVAIFMPGDTLNTLVILMGVFILVAGLGTALSAYKAKHNFYLTMGGITSIISVIIGLSLVFRPDFFVNMIVGIIGVILLVVGVLQLINVSNLKLELRNKRFYFSGGVLTLIIGIVFVAIPDLIINFVGFVIGVTLVIYAINELTVGLKMKKQFNVRKEIEDAEYEEV